MKIIRESYDRKKRDWAKDKVAKVSEAQIGDSIYLNKSEAEDAEFLDKVNALLNDRSLVVVTRKARVFDSGDVKLFIGDKNYKSFETELA
jgi:hypothetical protein